MNCTIDDFTMLFDIHFNHLSNNQDLGCSTSLLLLLEASTSCEYFVKSKLNSRINSLISLLNRLVMFAPNASYLVKYMEIGAFIAKSLVFSY